MLRLPRHVRHPLAILALALAGFVLLDNLVFRSGAYSWIQNPESLSGQLYNVVHYERARPPSGRKDILVSGNSRIDWAFWPHHYNISQPDSPFLFIRAAIAASTLKMWYFVLQLVDPGHDRYAAIVIPVTSYRIEKWVVDAENDYLNVQMLGQVLPVSAWTELIDSFSDSAIRKRAIRAALLASDGFGDDLMNLVALPIPRIVRLVFRKHGGWRWQHDWAGTAGSMEDFRVDPDSGQIQAFPPGLNQFVRKEAIREFQRPAPEDEARFTARNAATEARWLNKIIALYRDSPTRLIVLQTPRSPMPLPARIPIATAPDLRALLQPAGNVSFLDEDAFTGLEQPRYFYDTIHLNAEGRRLFTRQLGDRVTALLREQP